MVAIGRLCSEAWNRQENGFERNVQMENRLIAVLFVVGAAFCARGDTWADPETGIEWTYFVSNGEASLGSGFSSGTAVDESTTGEIIIPSSLGGCSVTSIGAYAFSGCTNLTSVTISDGVTGIGEEAFYGCSGLTSVTIPDSVTSIGDQAFFHCSSLASVTIPDSVTSFGADCLEGCPVYMRKLYQTILGAGGAGGSVPASTTIVQQVEVPYTLTDHVTDRAIASVTVDADCAIDEFVLKDGKVYDTMLYVSNTADREVTLSLPSGFSYKTIKGARPLAIPASSQCIISITRVAAGVFLVMREELSDVQ